MNDDELLRAAARHIDSPEQLEDLVDAVNARLAWRLRRGHKICSRCHEAKPVAAFGMDASREDGLGHRCKACDAARKR